MAGNVLIFSEPLFSHISLMVELVVYVLQHGNMTIGSHCTLHNEKSLRGNLHYLLWLESNSSFTFYKVSMSPKCRKKKGKEIWSKILNIKCIYKKGTSSWLYIITVYTHILTRAWLHDLLL